MTWKLKIQTDSFGIKESHGFADEIKANSRARDVVNYGFKYDNRFYSPRVVNYVEVIEGDA